MTDRDANQPLEFDDLEPLPEDAELTELEELPAEAELAELPVEAELAELPDDLEPLPVEAKPAPASPPVPAAKPVPAVAPKPVAATPKSAAQPEPKAQPKPSPAAAAPANVASAPKPAPAPKASPVAKAGAPLKAGAVTSSTGSRRERMEKDRETRKTKKKAPTWERFVGPGEKPKREMEKAPLLLRKAAFWLLIGCLLPWGGYTSDWTFNIVEKLLVIGGLYVWHQAHLLRDGVKVPGFIASLGKSSFIPLFAVAGVLAIVGFAPVLSMGSLSDDFLKNSGPFAEKGFLILAGLTLTHIYDYEHGGRFNPMFPIMFLAPAIAGVMALLRVFGAETMNIGVLLGGGGAILVAVAGSMAAYTMYVALKEAKAHGEAKKAAQAEARKAARASRK